MSNHRAKFLRQASLIEHAAAFAFDMRSHAEQCTDRGDAAAADTRQEDIPGTIQRRLARLRQSDKQRAQAHGFRFAQASPVYGDKAWAEAFNAAEILVAGVLVDLALAPQFGFQRQHRQAVGLDAAIAAALAHRRVDKGALLRVDQLAALAPTTLFSGAGLVIDDHGAALELAQLALHRVQLTAVVEADDRGEGFTGRVFLRLVADQGDGFHPFGIHLLAELIDAQLAVDGLAAGHG